MAQLSFCLAWRNQEPGFGLVLVVEGVLILLLHISSILFTICLYAEISFLGSLEVPENVVPNNINLSHIQTFSCKANK
jgi:hypothetical protein